VWLAAGRRSRAGTQPRQAITGRVRTPVARLPCRAAPEGQQPAARASAAPPALASLCACPTLCQRASACMARRVQQPARAPRAWAARGMQRPAGPRARACAGHRGVRGRRDRRALHLPGLVHGRRGPAQAAAACGRASRRGARPCPPARPPARRLPACWRRQGRLCGERCRLRPAPGATAKAGSCVARSLLASVLRAVIA